MDKWYKVELVQKMQDYISEHIDDSPFSFGELYTLTGYSKRHADRMFKELVNKTPKEYVRSLTLSNSSQKLLDGHQTILDTAFDANFSSHEGYIKAFFSAFGTSPGRYKKGKTPIPLFTPYPVKGYYFHLFRKDNNSMKNETCLCMITPVKMPKRKLIFLRSTKAEDYMSYCEEMSCDWEGLFNSIPSKLGTAAILTLPDFLMTSGSSRIASGVEIPYEYDGEIPKDCEIAELEPCEMLYFQSQSFTTDEEFFILMEKVFEAVDTFDASAYGYAYADDLAPRFNFGGPDNKGAKVAIPVKSV